MPKSSDLKQALEEIKLFRGLRGPVVESGNELKPRQGYGVFLSSDPHVASSYANPMGETIENWDDTPLAVFPLRVRPKKIIEFPVKKTEGLGNTFDKFAFDVMASRLKPGEALVARNVYDAGPRANIHADPEKRYSFPSDVWAVGPDVESTPLHKAKGGKVGNLDAALQYVKNKLPQVGTFSTLDELIANAPFDNVSADQWQKYLQPGRTFEREGVRFPLKKEELDWSMPDLDPTYKLSKEELRDLIRETRPDFNLRLGTNDARGAQRPVPTDLYRDVDAHFPDESKLVGRETPSITPAAFEDWAHGTGEGGYEELVTRSPQVGHFKGDHFSPQSIAHSRTSRQVGPEGSTVRLIDEIQSDRHSAANEKLYPDDLYPGTGSTASDLRYGGVEHSDEDIAKLPVIGRVGYRGIPEVGERASLPDRLAALVDERVRIKNESELHGELSPETWGRFARIPAEEASLRDRMRVIDRMVPDAPFKDPAEYALLQLRQEMLRGAKRDTDYLALTPGSAVSKRFSHTPEQAAGNAYAYDQVYKGQLEKLARQYGLPTEDISLEGITQKADTRPQAMIDSDYEHTNDMMDSIYDEIKESEPEYAGAPMSLAYEVLDQMKIEMKDSDHPRVHAIINETEEKIKTAIRELDKAKTTGEDPMDIAHTPEFRALFDNIKAEMRMVRQVHDDYKSSSNPDRPTVPETFPAIKLSPEAREKIKRIGVPIWMLGATATGSLMQDPEEKPAFAEGGSTHEGLAKLAKYLRSKNEGENLTDEQRERGVRFTSGLASQLYGLDENGEVAFLGGPRFAEKGMPVINPGLIDETLAVPALLDPIGEMIASQLAGTTAGNNPDKIRKIVTGLIHSPEWARRAEERSSRLKEMVQKSMGVGEAEGFQQNFDEALGTMFGQVPLPASKAKGLIAREGEGLLGRSIAAPIEFLSPTVDPKITNYLTGAVAGGELGDLPRQLQKDPLDENGAAGLAHLYRAEGGPVNKAAATAPIRDMLEELRGRYEAMTSVLPFVSEGASMPYGGTEMKAIGGAIRKAKGGKIKTLLELRQMLSDAPVEKGKELASLQDAVSRNPVVGAPTTPSAVEDIVAQSPVVPPQSQPPSVPLNMNRRSFIQGAASLASPVDVPLSASAALTKLAMKQLAPKDVFGSEWKSVPKMDDFQTKSAAILKRDFEAASGMKVSRVGWPEDDESILVHANGKTYRMDIGSDDDDFIFAHGDHEVTVPFSDDWMNHMNEGMPSAPRQDSPFESILDMVDNDDPDTARAALAKLKGHAAITDSQHKRWTRELEDYISNETDFDNED